MNDPRALLTFLSIVGVLVGVNAVLRPAQLLKSKGAAVNPAAIIWMRQVGVLVFSQGLTALLLRNEPVNPASRAFLIGAGVTQLGLLPIEISGYARGALTKLCGIVPNSVLHAVLGAALLYRAFT